MSSSRIPSKVALAQAVILNGCALRKKKVQEENDLKMAIKLADNSNSSEVSSDFQQKAHEFVRSSSKARPISKGSESSDKNLEEVVEDSKQTYLLELENAQLNQAIQCSLDEGEILYDYAVSIEEAQRKLEEAQRKLKEAQRKLGEAQRKLKEAQRAKEEAQHKLKEAQRKLGEAQRKLGEAQRELEKAQLEKAIQDSLYEDRRRYGNAGSIGEEKHQEAKHQDDISIRRTLHANSAQNRLDKKNPRSNHRRNNQDYRPSAPNQDNFEFFD